MTDRTTPGDVVGQAERLCRAESRVRELSPSWH